MPQFYLHLYNDEILKDDTGGYYPDEAAARGGALRTISELIAEHIVAGRMVDLSHRIDVENDQSEIVESVRFGSLFRGIQCG